MSICGIIHLSSIEKVTAAVLETPCGLATRKVIFLMRPQSIITPDASLNCSKSEYARAPIGESGIIYALIDPRSDEIRYIGKTVRPLKVRLRHHLKPIERKRKSRLSAWLTRLLRDDRKPKAIVIEHRAIQELDEAERYWIAYYRGVGCDLVNGTDGGTGGATRNGQKLTHEHRAKLMDGLRRAREEGRIAPPRHTPESRRKLSEGRMGMRFSEEHRRNIADAKRGKPLSEAHKQNIAAGLKKAELPADFGQRVSRGKKGVYTPAMRQQMERLHQQRRDSPVTVRTHFKLTPEQVVEIRKLLQGGQSLRVTANQFGVSKRTILFIKQGKTWKDVQDDGE